MLKDNYNIGYAVRLQKPYNYGIIVDVSAGSVNIELVRKIPIDGANDITVLYYTKDNNSKFEVISNFQEEISKLEKKLQENDIKKQKEIKSAISYLNKTYRNIQEMKEIEKNPLFQELERRANELGEYSLYESKHRTANDMIKELRRGTTPFGEFFRKVMTNDYNKIKNNN